MVSGGRNQRQQFTATSNSNHRYSDPSGIQRRKRKAMALDIIAQKATAKGECVQSECNHQIQPLNSIATAMNNIMIGAAALALMALLKKNPKDKDDNPEVTPAQKADRVITFYKA